MDKGSYKGLLKKKKNANVEMGGDEKLKERKGSKDGWGCGLVLGTHLSQLIKAD